MAQTLVDQLLSKFETCLATLPRGPKFWHPRLKDLALPEAVKMPEEGLFPPVEKEEDLLLHLTVTGRCNARCEGCINTNLTCQGREEVLQLFEADPLRDARALAQLISREGKPRATIAFYGGEPLLALSKMQSIVEMLDEWGLSERVRYMVYTNGQFLKRAVSEAKEFVSRVWLFSVSIDGRPEQHHRFRKGTDLFLIREGLSALKEETGARVLQWSTLREGQSLWDCVEEFLSLHEKGLADFFFWHLAEAEDSFEDFEGFASRYGKDLEKLLDVYEDHLSRGVLLPIVPLNELLVFWFTGEVRGHSACGVELATNFDLVGGRVLACADLPAELTLGEVSASGEISWRGNGLLERLVAYRGVLGCERCGVYPYCGGRCPVQVLTGSPARTLAYCILTRLFVGLVAERAPRLQEALLSQGFTPEKIYRHSAFLARYTDVIP
ncbi:MAG: 4Fe-4S cluster-binding domain-containing protein [Thermodesulfobacteria bacterium]|nr:4Fe-4S cluster-binding domain-containing protein [Thermodesulfobacteriota bacterium]